MTKKSGGGGSREKQSAAPSAQAKARVMRYASLHPDSDMATSGGAKRIQAAHDRSQAKQ
ncbi:hypothetical protein [Nonomuraea sp. LPB2021202275-12-8]|uniref:hypothetical protein n=1 Tax=Nonomuraea sp. LPB2021202275-12-8 TaxID=3120159 RepID=UPI00300C3F6E